MAQFTLVTGGARSGKSSFAELLAAQAKTQVIYIATAQIWDKEMAMRVKKHRRQRPSSWRLIEEPRNICDTLLQLKDENGVILLDCVTLWLSNLLFACQTQSETKTEILTELSESSGLPDLNQVESQILTEVQEVALLVKIIKPSVIFVTNEVGQGIVPENPLARAYRDISGRSNQILAQCADHVYLVVAGLPLEIKHSGEKLLASLLKE